MTTNAAEVSIRRAVEADRETLIELIIRGFEDVTAHRWREQRYGVIGGRTWDEWKADDMRQIDVSQVVIAEVEGKPVGFATFTSTKGRALGRWATMPCCRSIGAAASAGSFTHACSNSSRRREWNSPKYRPGWMTSTSPPAACTSGKASNHFTAVFST